MHLNRKSKKGAALATLAIALGASQIGSAGAPYASSPFGSGHTLAAYGKLPVAFVPNAGQEPGGIRYVARGAGYSFAFTAKSVRVSLAKGRAVQSLSLDFVGANPRVRVSARERLGGMANYFVGSDRSRWHAGLATYREIVYRNLWPGIDMRWRGANGTLKYEFLVRPGASARAIRLAYRGVRLLSLGPSGNLLVATSRGVLEDSAPLAYQRIEGRRVLVSSRFALGRNGKAYGFVLGGHDADRPLVIDPGLRYSSFLGGAGSDTGFAIAVDDHGSAYVAGFTGSVNFPTTPGAFQAANAGDFDGFVTKLNRSGSGLVYSTYLGGTNDDLAIGIAVDERGSAYVSGLTQSGNFPTTPGAFQTSDPDPAPVPDVCNEDGFVAKLNRTGSALVYSTYHGGVGEDSANIVAVDESGNAVLAGSGDTSSFPTTPGSFQPVDPTPGPCDPEDPRPADNTGIVSKLNRSGSALVFATYLGGTSGFVNVNGMTIDEQGNVYLTGPADDDFPTTPGAFQSTDPTPGTDAFVTKLNASGSALGYSTYLGGAADESDEGGLGIGVDDHGSAYVAGRTGSPVFPITPGAYDTTFNGVDDGFVTKLNRAGSALVYSTYLGGSDTDEPHFSVAIDEDGRAWVEGTTASTDFPTTPGAVQPVYGGGVLAGFVTRLNPSGSALDYSTYLGGLGRDIANCLALDEEGMAYVTGSTRSSTFPTTPGAFDTTHNGSSDAFVTKLELQNEGSQP
jgi:hypothetical protein